MAVQRGPARVRQSPSRRRSASYPESADEWRSRIKIQRKARREDAMPDEPETDEALDLDALVAERIAEYRLCLLPLEDELLAAAERLEDEELPNPPSPPSLGGKGGAG
jgi:hypothetical protein